MTQLFFPDDFAYETKILEQIGNVRDAQMKATAAFARAEAAAQDEKTAAAEGRANVAKARAAAEVEKQKAVTAAEQARDVAVLAAEARKTVASEDALAASEEKRANILRGEGEAARKKHDRVNAESPLGMIRILMGFPPRYFVRLDPR